MTNDWIPSLAPSNQPKYMDIARAIEADICAGVLEPGQLLPTHRDLADKLGVALGTVTRAYKEAERRGLIVGRGRRGTSVRTCREVGSLLSSFVDSYRHVDDRIYTLAYGAEVPSLTRALKRLSSRPAIDSLLHFTPERERPEHQAEGVRWLERLGITASPESVAITMGAHQGLMISLAAETTGGEAIGVEAHTYVGLIAIADFLGLRMVALAMDREGILPDSLEAACRRDTIKAVCCLPTAQNPTNASMSETRRREIVAVAEKYGVMIMEDDPLRPAAENPPPLFRTLAPEICYLITSPSKLVCPGLKVGWILPPHGRWQRLIDQVRATIVRPIGLSSEIFGLWMNDGTVDNTIEQAKREGAARQKLVEQYLPRELVHTNPASYFVWLELPECWTASVFAAEATRRGVSVWPAETFAVDPSKAARAVRFVIGDAISQVAFLKSLRELAGLLACKPRSQFHN